MLVVDSHVHLHTRTYFEAHVERIEPPRAERAAGGYVVHTPGGGCSRVPASHHDVEAHLERCAALGIDAVVSSMGRFNVHHLPPGRACELAMRLNEEHADLERAHPGRYYGLALLPMQDTQAAIETLDHAVRTLGLRGVCICSNVNGESIATPGREPIYRRIAELGVPIFLHAATLGPGFDPRVAALDLVRSGVLDRHPSLRVVDLRLGEAPSRLVRRLGDERLRHLYADTAHVGRRTLRAAAHVLGTRQLLYGSDYPHRDPAAGLGLVRDVLDGADSERVMGANAAALLGLAADSGFAAVPAQTSRASLRRSP
jgi:predicted TIM-barrel fold metal-dependent hydrolase